METSINLSHQWIEKNGVKTIKPVNTPDNFFAAQAKNRTGWFLLSLMVQGIFCLPVPSILIYYFGAPALLVVIPLTLFFANVIAGMGGAGVRVLIYLFAASVAIHLLLLAMFIL